MAIDQGTTTETITSQERTWRINIETTINTDPVITVYRQAVKTSGDGSVISIDSAPIVVRNLSEVATQEFTVNDKTYTMFELATVIAAVADTWRTEDMKNAS